MRSDVIPIFHNANINNVIIVVIFAKSKTIIINNVNKIILATKIKYLNKNNFLILIGLVIIKLKNEPQNENVTIPNIDKY